MTAMEEAMLYEEMNQRLERLVVPRLDEIKKQLEAAPREICVKPPEISPRMTYRASLPNR